MVVSHQQIATDTSYHYSCSSSDSESGFAGTTDLLMADPDPQTSRSLPTQGASSGTTRQIDTQP